MLPAALAFELRLREATPRATATLVIAAANVALFAAMAGRERRLVEIGAHALGDWGAAYAPWVFGGQWWRAASSMFLHAGLAHLAGNVCLLLLSGPQVERLLGTLRYSAVYAFSGAGALLLSLGWFPEAVTLGASGAVMGVYGALVGCYLRGPREVPLRLFGRYAGASLLLAGSALLLDRLSLERSLVAHLGGFALGLAGGLLFGHVLRPAAAGRSPRLLALQVGACAGVVAALGCAAWASARKPLAILKRYDEALRVDRELTGRYADALGRWGDGKVSDAELLRLLRDRLIPAADRARCDLQLKLAPEHSYWEGARLTPRHLFPSNRPRRSQAPTREKEAPEKEYDELLRLYLKE